MDRPQYVNWIVREAGVVFEDQQPLNCYRLSYVVDDAILDDWALHIRRHYVPDDELEEDAALNKLTVEEYLRQYVIPQKGESFGPTARSNDISEILFADLFEFILNYEVPRCKQHNRSGKNESEHGTDIIAYRFFAEGKAPHKNDELVAIEVKALLSSNEAGKVIKDAVTDSKKDEDRVSHTLNYYRKKLRFMQLGHLQQLAAGGENAVLPLLSPSFITAPLPNCFSIWLRAASKAFCLSSNLLSSFAFFAAILYPPFWEFPQKQQTLVLICSHFIRFCSPCQHSFSQAVPPVPWLQK